MNEVYCFSRLDQGDGSHMASEDPTFLTEAVEELGASTAKDLQSNVPVST